MPTNVTYEYENAEKEYLSASSFPDKIKCLQKMLTAVPKHKGTENLRNDIKRRISKYKSLVEREKKLSKSGGRGLSIKKDGAARIILIGITNSGKSTLLKNITNAKPEIAEYDFTTKKPEIGTLDYDGIILQVIEIPAITKNYLEKEKGPAYMGIVRDSDLIVIVSRDKKDVDLVKKELDDAGIKFNGIVLNSEDVKAKEKIWKKLRLVYVYTKSPGKDKDYPPIALRKKSNVRDLASKVHRDFIKKFDYARVWGNGAKFDGQRVGLGHILKEKDIVELHLK
ncbi:TGS domain-containing protein [Candidatus Woesearchaeota archaeon]|jgi:ribosome-interacting GTPase 1|nr:TGS domain-containing protein [Cryomorphaceae bacterium]MBT6995725.1 TGS domain-containing protein [Candidatus Woesearchaeota archaeon]MBT7237821.1 TGS domain-containing protein [Candidatus Woesearchaeota archaeon]